MARRAVQVLCASVGLVWPVWTNRFLLHQTLADYWFRCVCALVIALVVTVAVHQQLQRRRTPVYSKRVTLVEYEREGKESTRRALRALKECKEFSELRKKVEADEVHSAWEEPDEPTEDDELLKLEDKTIFAILIRKSSSPIKKLTVDNVAGALSPISSLRYRLPPVAIPLSSFTDSKREKPVFKRHDNCLPMSLMPPDHKPLPSIAESPSQYLSPRNKPVVSPLPLSDFLPRPSPTSLQFVRPIDLRASQTIHPLPRKSVIQASTIQPSPSSPDVRKSVTLPRHSIVAKYGELATLKRMSQTLSPVDSKAQSSAASPLLDGSPKSKVEYKPYTLRDYHSIKEEQYQELGVLGPWTIGSEEWRRRKQFQDRRKVYAQHVLQSNCNSLAIAICRGRPAKTKTPSPNPRSRALAFAKTIKPPVQTKPNEWNYDEEERQRFKAVTAEMRRQLLS